VLPMSLMAGSSLEFDAARLVALGSRQEQREEPIAIFRLDAIRIDLDGEGERAIEFAGDALAPMDAHVVRIIHALFAGDADGIGLGLDLQFVLIDARQLHQRQDVVALLKDVDGRKRAAAGGRTLEPVARKSGFKLPLQAQQCVERIGKGGDHAAPHADVLRGEEEIRPWSLAPRAIDLGCPLALSRGEC
jgi:hypothetical protein